MSIIQLAMEDITLLDRQIEQLYDYKPIPEHEVKVLCDKVSIMEFILTSTRLLILCFHSVGQGNLVR